MNCLFFYRSGSGKMDRFKGIRVSWSDKDKSCGTTDPLNNYF